jgi:galactokinase
LATLKERQTMTKLEGLQNEFARIYGGPPEHIVRAPGRVNLIGEHTDYNAGFVLPMAIDREMLLAARKRKDQRIHMVALDFSGSVSEFSLDAAIQPDQANKWSNYVRGVAWALLQHGLALPGLDLAIRGNVPVASGLSSSAALEVCSATTFQTLAGFEMSKVDLVRLCQKAENEFVGVKSGIMDQFISALAREGHALLIDCRDLSYQNVPLPRGASIAVCDSMKRRGLVNSEYNTRRAECEEAARRLGVTALRDASLEQFVRLEKEMPANVARRARHVITENARVLRAVVAARENDLEAFGTLMNESHESLRNDYAVSCAELDALVEIAHAQQGCLGARLTGAGFGGCTVNLVRDTAVDTFVSNVARDYVARMHLAPQIYVCRAMDGASVIF